MGVWAYGRMGVWAYRRIDVWALSPLPPTNAHTPTRPYASPADSRPLLRLWEFDAIAKNVRVGYVFFFDDRDEYLEGDRVVGQPDLRDSISAAMDRLGARRKKHHPDWILGVQPFWKPLGVELFHFL